MEQDRIMAALLEVRERVSDPDRLVLDPHSTWETADGYVAGQIGHCRACLLGHAWDVADAHGFDRWEIGGRIEMAAKALGYHSSPATTEAATAALADGVTVEVVDEAIRMHIVDRERALVPA